MKPFQIARILVSVSAALLLGIVIAQWATSGHNVNLQTRDYDWAVAAKYPVYKNQDESLVIREQLRRDPEHMTKVGYIEVLVIAVHASHPWSDNTPQTTRGFDPREIQWSKIGFRFAYVREDEPNLSSDDRPLVGDSLQRFFSERSVSDQTGLGILNFVRAHNSTDRSLMGIVLVGMAAAVFFAILIATWWPSASRDSWGGS